MYTRASNYRKFAYFTGLNRPNRYKNEAAAFIFLDQKKAFDRMSHSYMVKTLRHFGLGENFIQWVQIIYKNCNARVKVNGFISDSFKIERRVRQGCPLSSLLYVLCAETLSLEINNNAGTIQF